MIILTAANESQKFAPNMESLRPTLHKNATIGINKELALDQMMQRNWVFLSSLVNLELVVIVTTALEKLTKLVKCAIKL